MLHLALSLEGTVLYVSGEESEQQIRMRAERVGVTPNEVYILAETSLQNIFQQIEQLQPKFLVLWL